MSAIAAFDDSVASALNPFPGLRPFEPDEDYLFFGRERHTDELLRRLRTTRFLSILGRSGSGKSSLVRSGLIPSLHGGAMAKAGSRWRVAILRPGEDPLGNLAAALVAPEALGAVLGEEAVTRALFETTLRASQRGLIECIRQSRIASNDNVLVLVDQFEELFRYKRSRRVVGSDEAVAFVKLLVEARASEVPCYIAITMRSDFVGECMEFAGLPEIINDGIYLVPRMARDELKLAITGPVAVGGATIAPRLVSRLLNDVGDDPDQLPILQHAMMRTWDAWVAGGTPDEPLDLPHYEAIGTMREALSRHAEEALHELDPAGQTVAEKTFKALTDKGTDPRGVRRPAPMTEICALAGASFEEVSAVVEHFRNPGRSFLMPPVGVPLHEGSILDISHESLMRIWWRLSEWADQEARSSQLYLSVAKAAQRHAEGVAALWRDPELQLALSWRRDERPTKAWAARYDPSFDQAMAFLDASQQERDREVQEREARRRRALRQARTLVAILSTASIITLALGAYAYVQKGEAQQAQRSAEVNLRSAQAAFVRVRNEKTRTEQQRLRAEEEARRASAEQLKAEEQTRIATEQRSVAESQTRRADSERLNAVAKEREAQAQRQRAETAQQDAEAQRRTAETARGAAELAEAETRKLSHVAAARALALKIPQMKDQPERSALLALQVYRLNRDSGGKPNDPDIYEAMRAALDRVRNLPVLRGTPESIRALAAEPDGRSVLAAADDGRILRFDLDGKRPPSPIGTVAGEARSLAIRAAGDLVAAGSAGGAIRIFDLRNPAATPRDLAGGSGVVSALAFERSGSRLAAGNHDGTVRVWNLDGDAQAITFQGGKRITSVAFSPDGKTLVAGVAQGGALQWDLTQPSAPALALCDGLDVRSIAFAPNGGTLACGGSRGEILQVSLRPNVPDPPRLLGHRASVNSLAFDRTGAFLASASSDKDVRLWDVRNASTRSVVLPGHDSWAWAVAFTPDGERLVSAGEDRTVRVWPARNEVLFDDLCRAMSGAASPLTTDEWHEHMPNVPLPKGEPCHARL